MSRASLTLVHRLAPVAVPIPFTEMLADHQAIVQGYLDTHLTRNHSEHTIGGERRFLVGWHAGFPVPDAQHHDGTRQLLVWEAMVPVAGRERIVAFAKGLVEAGLKPRTIHGYLGALRRLYQYILDYPYIPGTDGQSIVAKYGPLAQPVSEYDYPVHTIDQEDEGFVLAGERLDQFYDYVRYDYVARNQKKLPASRDYTMIVVAGECGLRASEIAHLDALGPHRDLFYQEKRLQTRAGKGVRGSGPRVRKTLFAPGTQETMRVYEARIRPHFPNAQTNPALFLTEGGTRIGYKAMWRSLHVIAQGARAAGVALPPTFAWHSLRKSFATNFMERHPGQPWELLMDLLGHMNPSTIHRYVRHSRVYLDQALDRLVDELVPDPAPGGGGGRCR